jgi:Putative phage holin Dp-1
LTIKNSAVYDKLKWLALIGLPALGTLYFALAGIWGLPAAEQVVGTIVTIDTFLGAILGISTSNYASESVGDLVVNETATGKQFSLELNNPDVESIADVDEARFNVKKKN